MTANRPARSLTVSAEDYLKAIYTLSADAPASTTEIAQRLDLAPASVTGMIRRLSSQKLLDHQPYRGVVLTPAGRRMALRVLRRHRVIEAYLAKFLGYRMDDVHAEADRLEHAASDALVERMAAALGHPRVDPHGDPIPDADGRLDKVTYTALADLPLGQDAQLRRVTATEPERLRYLAEAGLVPGARVCLVDRQPFDGPVTVRVAGAERTLGREMARLLLCDLTVGPGRAARRQ
ncbi:MAG TPA: metal-dependent transcriptional regulator [Vicinamibacterales bacterium]|mgnify:FL=1|nr:metal-dependent transcriptional regulator [Acidobacteriota bacterium]HOC17029.1 metal-dependent transcriptional regulator [Vicinamibacterales bacterium]